MTLDDIVAYKRQEIERAKAKHSLAELQARTQHHARERDFQMAVRRKDEIALIAEIKERSPSRGVIRERFDPIALAKALEEAGAHALSVLTDAKFFGGNLEFLADIKQFTELPVLRKDFIIDAYQIYESAWRGADAVLLIARLLEDRQLAAFLRLTKQLHLDALVEVHSKAELFRALQAGAEMIGINHRDLATLKVNTQLSEELIPLIPRDRTIVAESGINRMETVSHLQTLGAHAVLVGEALMEQSDVGRAAKELMGWPLK